MSHNLTLECTKTGKTFHLWQTPTYITDMCLWPSHSSTNDIAMRYRYWVNSNKRGVWKSEADYEMLLESIRDHLKELDEFLAEHPHAKFASN